MFKKILFQSCIIICFVLVDVCYAFAQETRTVAFLGKYFNQRVVNTYHFDKYGFSYTKGERGYNGEYTYDTPIKVREPSELKDWSFIEGDERVGTLYSPKGCEFSSTIEVRKNGNIYTYPDGGSFPAYSFFHYAKDRVYQPYTYYTIHGKKYPAGWVEMNTVQIKGRINSIENCYNNLDWNKVKLLTPCYAQDAGEDFLMTYTVMYDAKVPAEVWNSAMQIKSSFPGFLAEDYIDEMYGAFEQAVISIINKDKVQVTRSLTLMGISEPSFFWSHDSEGNVVLLCFNVDGGNKVEITSKKPLYLLNLDLSIRAIFTPKDGERLSSIVEYSPGLYLLFGSTTQHGYIGYENPMIVALDSNIGAIKEKKEPFERRWYYPTPRKGYFRRVKMECTNKHIYYIETIEEETGSVVYGLHQEFVALDMLLDMNRNKWECSFLQ